ncbi:unnamed protein product [Ascophyllum nodosum]
MEAAESEESEGADSPTIGRQAYSAGPPTIGYLQMVQWRWIAKFSSICIGQRTETTGTVETVG